MSNSDELNRSLTSMDWLPNWSASMKDIANGGGGGGGSGGACGSVSAGSTGTDHGDDSSPGGLEIDDEDCESKDSLTVADHFQRLKDPKDLDPAEALKDNPNGKPPFR